MKAELHEIATSGTAPSLAPSPLLVRVRAVMDTLDLDCRCRGKLDAALERFEALENRRQLRGLILDARHQAERIGALLELVGELDTVSTDETDLSVFQEIALLFEDIKAAATRGSEDMVRAAGLDLHGGQAA
ncbi:hypothetical protein [Microvirga guangxiensis]|uniref:Uncharacterized protein n=1 Tax=Microvirga guangxiensis TaxID=549386 RepID=A0A1G5LMU8_9HYPH|nr:hypothetical protein [Microvirga guangxiensis]SCZ13801.1 hypothetical protein SAMN02927923_04494 [Microvirga guangxiensis]